MNIKTQKPVAIVLGGSIPHIPVFQNLKEKGYYCVLFDYLEHPIAKTYADVHIQVDIHDKELVLELAEKYDPKAIITICLDRPITTACYVAEQLNLPIPYDYKTSELVTNKILMKERMVSSHIPTSNYTIIDEENFQEKMYIELNCPLIVKPIDSTGSLGVIKVNAIEELGSAIKTSFEHSKKKQLIIEEFVGGEEWNMYFFIKDSEPQLLMVLQKLKIKDNQSGLQQVGSFVIPESNNIHLTQVNEIAKKVVIAFNLTKGPLLIQAKVTDGKLSVIEIAARLGGTALSNAMMKELKDIDIIDLAIRSYLGDDFEIPQKTSKKILLSNFIYSKPGIFKEILHLKELQVDGIVKQHYILKNEGDVIPKGITSKNRVGAFFVDSDSVEGALKKVEEAVKAIEVNDINNSSLLYNQIYAK